MFGLRVEFASANLLQIVVLLQCLELLLQDCCCFHRSEDTGDPAEDFEEGLMSPKPRSQTDGCA